MKLCIIFNTESAFWYEKDETFRRVVDSSDFICCDGAALASAAKVKGVFLPRYHGPDLMEDILSDQEFSRIYLLGGSDQAHAKIKKDFDYPNRKIIGDTCFYPTELPADALKKIKDAKPQVVFVCLGLLKQERFAAHIRKELRDLNGLTVGVGASVDFLGGTKVRSHKVFQRIGLEWLPRMIREPRMLKRNFRALRSIPMILAGSVQIIRTGNFIANLEALKKHLAR